MKFLLILTTAGILNQNNVNKALIKTFETKDAMTAYLNSSEMLTGQYPLESALAYSSTPLTITWKTKNVTTTSTGIDKVSVQ